MDKLESGRPEGSKNKEFKMINITVNIPEELDDSIKLLVEQRRVPSRSECLRRSVKERIRKDITFRNRIQNGGLDVGRTKIK